MAEYVRIYDRYPGRRAEMINLRATVMFHIGLTAKHPQFLKETCEAIGATEEQFKNWYFEFSDPTQEQAEKLAKYWNKPEVKKYFIPLENQISAIDLTTGQEIRVEEC